MIKIRLIVYIIYAYQNPPCLNLACPQATSKLGLQFNLKFNPNIKYTFLPQILRKICMILTKVRDLNVNFYKSKVQP